MSVTGSDDPADAPAGGDPGWPADRLRDELARRERELAEARRLLQGIFDSSTEYSIVVLDLDAVVVNWNEGARRGYGYSGREAVGTLRLPQLHAPEDVASGRVSALLHEAFASGAATGVFDCLRKSGEPFTADVSLTLRRGGDDAPVGYLLISKNITGQRRLEEQLARKREEVQEQSRRVEQASRHKTAFLANMSHELRTPLNGVIGFTQILHDGGAGPISDEQRELTADVLASARHLLQLINDILDLAKVEAGKLELRPEPTDLGAVVAEVRDVLRPLWDGKHLRVAVEVDPALGPVVQDPSRVKQVLYNYFSNAIKFTPEGGAVTVRVAPEGADRFRIEVRDSGIGIRTEDVDRLFAEFQQLDAGTSKRFQGTGLGLAVTRRIVEMQGGSVGVRSQVGEGSAFHAVLPRMLVQGDDAGPVLIVDHDARDRRQIERALAAAGYRTEAVARGHDAVRRCAERRYAAIVMDLLLEDVSGSEVLKAIRAGGRNVATPVIVASVVADLAATAGALRSLVKPVRDQDVVEALRQCGVRPRPADA